MTASALAGLRILVVDDDEQVLAILERALKRLGVGEVTTARDGVEALAVMKSSPVGVLLCDLEMPNMDGVQLMTAIARQQLRPSVILMSGAGPARLKAACATGEAAGLSVAAALEKPLTPSTLEHALLHAVQKPALDVQRFFHDAAAPLMTIRMLAEMMLDDPTLQKVHADDVRRIMTAAEQLQELIRSSRG